MTLGSPCVLHVPSLYQKKLIRNLEENKISKNAFGNTGSISSHSQRMSTSGHSSILLRVITEPVSVCRSLPSPVNVTVNRISGHNHMTVVHTLYHGAEEHTVVVMDCGFQAKPY